MSYEMVLDALISLIKKSGSGEPDCVLGLKELAWPKLINGPIWTAVKGPDCDQKWYYEKYLNKVNNDNKRKLTFIPSFEKREGK